MDITAIERMEEFARGVLKLFPEEQAHFFDELENSGLLSADEVKGLKEYVALYHMFADQRYYKMVRECVKEMYLAEITR